MRPLRVVSRPEIAGPGRYNVPMNSAHSNHQVIVIGGGLVGKAAALALTQAGLRVALLAQRAPEPSEYRFDTRIYALSSSSQALLERLRVWQALDPARLCPVYDMRVFGDAHAQLHFSAFQAAVPQLAWIVESSLIERALDAALQFQPLLTWCESRAQALQHHPEAVSVTLDDARVLSADLVVGADGAHSWVRQQVGAKVKRRDYRQTGVVANFRCNKPHHETAFQWFIDGEILALLPLPDSHVSLVWSARTEHANGLLQLDLAALAERIEAATGGASLHQVGTLEGVTPARGFPLALQTVDRLIAPRVALVGDAAHLIHPLAGQGVNLGLRDVAALLDVVNRKEPFRDLGDLTLLRRYERSRREDIQNLTIATDGLQRLFALPGGLARGIRNVGMAMVGAQPFIKRWLVSAALG